MAKITLADVSNLIDATTAKTTINNNSALIETAIENTFFRDGTSPNQMEANMDMNSFHVLNLPQPATNNEPLRLSDLNSFIGGGTVTNIPAGGLTANILSKASNADYDVHWSTLGSSLLAGTNISITGTNVATISTVGVMTLAGTETVTGAKTFANNGGLRVAGSSTGVTFFASANAGASNFTLTLPALTDNLVSRTSTDTLTNKTLTSPVLTTPSLGVATATSINKVTITAPATSATLTLIDGTVITGPSATGTLAALNGTNSWAGANTFVNGGGLRVLGSSTGSTFISSANAGASNFTLTLPAVTDTVATLGGNQSWTGANTFANSGGARIKGSSTGTNFLASANAGASDFTITFPATTGTVALTSGVVTSFNALTGAVTTNVTKQTFSATGTYTPTANMAHCIIECWGGGGGGGGAAGAGAANQGSAGGGGAGAYARLYTTAAAIGASKAVTIGALGTGGAAGNNAGAAGGSTSVGVLCIAPGGSGGAGAPASAGALGGTGGTGATGDIAGSGQNGFSAVGGAAFVTIGFSGGAGGSSGIGGGGASPNITGAGGFNGNAASGWGAGGSGGSSYNSATTASGGNGSQGFVVITEFINV